MSKEYFFSNSFRLTIAIVKYLVSSDFLDFLTVIDAFKGSFSPFSFKKKSSISLPSISFFLSKIKKELIDSRAYPFRSSDFMLPNFLLVLIFFVVIEIKFLIIEES